MSTNFAGWLSGFTELAQMLMPVIYISAAFCGLWYAALALMKIRDMGKDNGRDTPTWGAVMGNLLVTLVSTCLASWVHTLSENYGSIGSGLSSQMAYMRDSAASDLKPMWTAIYAWMLLLGVCAIWRAVLLFNRAAQGNSRDGDSWWAGFWHVVGGAVLVNIATH